VGNFRWAFMAAIFGAVVSLLLGLVSGVGFGLVLVRALIFGVVFFGLGFALYFVVNTYFPELLYLTEDTTPQTNEVVDGHISIAMDSMGEYAVPELFNKQGDPNEIGNIEDLISGVFRPGGDNRRDSGETSQPEYPNVNFSMDAEGLDQNKETSYNDSSEFGDASFGDLGDIGSGSFNETPAVETPPPAEKHQVFQPQFTPQIGGDDSGLGGLPDLDMMAMAFTNMSDNQSMAASAPTSAPASTPAPSMGSVSSDDDDSGPDRSQYKGNKPQALKGDFQPQAIAQGIRTVLSKD
jgi:hypothetical protein